jgi:hypothetical protein
MNSYLFCSYSGAASSSSLLSVVSSVALAFRFFSSFAGFVSFAGSVEGSFSAVVSSSKICVAAKVNTLLISILATFVTGAARYNGESWMKVRPMQVRFLLHSKEKGHDSFGEG